MKHFNSRELPDAVRELLRPSEQVLLACAQRVAVRHQGLGATLVERFDIEPFPDFSAK